VATRDEEIDRLFALPLDEFTAARNELAKQLKEEGEADAADEVRALAKPSAPVWAINQAARGDADAVRALLDAGDELRAAQARALSAQGGREGLRSAQAAERGAMQRLARRARQALEDGGRSASRAQLEKVERTLGAAALDPEAREQLRAGRLTHELEPAGFEALAGLAPARPAAVHDDLAERRRQKEEQQARKLALQQVARDAERRARDAERDAEQAEHEAVEARRAAEKARAAADDAAAELDEL
jgi:hypothetical protein